MDNNDVYLNESDFLDSVYSQVPKTLNNEIETALAAYIALGKRTNYMSEFFFNDEYDRYYIYINDQFKFEGHKNIAICTGLSRQYNTLLSMLGIESEIVVDPRDDYISSSSTPHVYPVLHLKNGRNLKVDLTKDLYRVNLGNILRHFGSNPVDKDNPYLTFNSQEMYQMCNNVGYLNSNKAYMNKIWSNLNSFVRMTDSEISLKDSLEFVLTLPLKYDVFSNLGPVERVCFYNAFFSNMKKARKKDFKDSKLLEDCVKKTYFKKRFLPTTDKTSNLKLNNRNDAYNVIFSVVENDNSIHYIQERDRVLHFDNSEIEKYIKDNHIMTYSNLPFQSRERA